MMKNEMNNNKILCSRSQCVVFSTSVLKNFVVTFMLSFLFNKSFQKSFILELMKEY